MFLNYTCGTTQSKIASSDITRKVFNSLIFINIMVKQLTLWITVRSFKKKTNLIQGIYRISIGILPIRPEMSEYFLAGLKDGGALIDESKRRQISIKREFKAKS